MMIFLTVLALIAALGAVASVVEVRRDGYRPQPVRRNSQP